MTDRTNPSLTYLTHAVFFDWQRTIWIKSQAHVLQVPGHGFLVIPRIPDKWAGKEGKTNNETCFYHSVLRTRIVVWRYCLQMLPWKLKSLFTAFIASPSTCFFNNQCVRFYNYEKQYNHDNSINWIQWIKHDF